MSFNNYNFESETNPKRSRVGCYIHSSLNYFRKSDLEEHDLHIVIIDIKLIKNLRLLNVYRPFNPPNNVNRELISTISYKLFIMLTQETLFS
jgi:hypothetical protein